MACQTGSLFPELLAHITHLFATDRNIQVSNFLNNMATTIDLKSINHQVNGDTVVKPQYSSHFDPIRRKMEVSIPEAN